MAYLSTDNKVDLNKSEPLPPEEDGEYHILPIEELDLEFTHPKHGYNVMREMCHLGCDYDILHMKRLNNISKEEKDISDELDTLLLALDQIYAQLKDPTATENIDLSDILEQHLESIDQMFTKIRKNDQALSTSHSPFQGLDLASLTREQIETKVISQLESMKRGRQNAIPQLMTKLQLTVQIYTSIIDMLRSMQETDNNLYKHIQQRMGH
jgi:hypothetical protein